MEQREEFTNVELINANPSAINNKSLNGCNISGLFFSNILIKNLTLEDVEAMESRFINVTFENCLFIKVEFFQSEFSNVAFKNCKFHSLGNSFNHKKITSLTNSTFRNVLFEQTELVYVDFMAIDGDGGYIIFKNIDKAIPRGQAPFMAVSNAHIRVLNSTINGVIAGDEQKTVTSITKNSKYINGGIYCDYNFIINSDIQDGDQIGAFKILVVTNSVVDGDVGVRGGNGYLLNNTYLSSTQELLTGNSIIIGVGIHANTNDNIYIVAKDNNPTALRIFGGNITLRNFTLVNTIIGTPLENMPDINSLNLKDITIIGGSWKGKIHGGKWENVNIYPEVIVRRANIQNIQAYRLEYPKGNPWKKEGEFVLDIKGSAAPFDWPEIKVPTYEELGLVWWPEVEPGYHGTE